MRVLVWNMDHWLRRSVHAEAWSWLREESGADVALLQESTPEQDPGRVIYRPIGGTRQWGSSVIGLTMDVVPVEVARGRAQRSDTRLPDSHPGTIAIGSTTLGDRSLTLVSAYGLIEDGYADTAVHRQLSDLAPLFDDPIRGRHLLFGGDLNITTQWTGSQARYRGWERTTFARIDALGLVDLLDRWRVGGPLEGCDCLDGAWCRHVQTQDHPRSSRPWQNDYAFGSEALLTEQLVTNVEVLDTERTRGLSQHRPIMITLSA